MGDWSGPGRLEGGLDRARLTGVVGRLEGELDGVPVFWTGGWTGVVQLERGLERGGPMPGPGLEGGSKPEKNLDWVSTFIGRGVISGTEVGPGRGAANSEACDWRGAGAGIGGKS